MNRVLPLLLLSLAVLAVRLKSTHLAGTNRYNAEEELAKVTSQQSKFEEQFVALTREVESVSDVLSTTTNPDERINALETSLLQWRQDVFDLSRTIIPAFNLSKCSCEGITPQQKSRILNDLTSLRSNVEELRSRAEQMERCDKTEQVIADARKQLFFLDTMREILITGCKKTSIIGPTIFQTNLYADNWILGNYTTEDIMKIYNKRTEQYDNVTNCPLERPFFDGKQCIQCPPGSPVFNMETQQCGNCPAGERVDDVAKRCTSTSASQAPSFQTNPDAGNIIAPWGRPASTSGIATCPSDRPYFNGRECIQCYPPNNLWNSTSRICTSCPAGLFYNSQKKECTEEPQGAKTYNTNPHASNVWGRIPQRNNAFEDCPHNRPYFNGHSCIQCEYPLSIFNASSGECTSCPQGTYLASGECKKIDGWKGTSLTADSGQFNINPLASRIISRTSIARNPHLPNCPIERPFFDGRGCIECHPPDDLFNYTSKTCTSCSTGQVYSADSMSCEQQTGLNTTSPGRTNWVSNLTNSNWLTHSDNPADVYEQINRRLKQPNSRLCPQGREFFNGHECTSCSQNTYFNIDTRQCESCAEGEKFSLNLHKCIRPESFAEYQTNPNTTNIIYDGLPSNSYQTLYEQNKQVNPKIRDCPADRPFYDGISCIACSARFPYFNLNQKVCQQCPANSTYSPANRECESNEGKIIYQGPTLEKMLAGIF